MTEGSEHTPKTKEQQMVEVIATLMYRSLQWDGDEIAGWDVTMVESLLPTLMKPFLVDAQLLEENKALKQSYNALDDYQHKLLERIQQLENDLADVLDVKDGKGPTAMTMLLERIKTLEEEREALRKLAQDGINRGTA